jgi:hypothetical protein
VEEERPVELLERWCLHGADYRVLHLTEVRAVVQLLTCTGEPVDRLESSDRDLIEWLEEHAGADRSD